MKLLLIIFLVLPFSIWTQSNFDSLWSVWNNSNLEDTSRLKAIKNYSREGFLFSQPDSAIYFAKKHYDFAKEKGIKNHIADALTTQGVAFYLQGNFLRAVEYYTKCLKIREEIGDMKGIASTLNNIGNIYYDQDNLSKAIYYYSKSLEIKKILKDQKGMANSTHNLGNVYSDQGNYSKAIEYLTISLKIEEELDNKKGVSNTLNSIGAIYYEQGDIQKAIDYYSKSLTINERLKDKNGIAQAYNNLGNIYSDQHEYSKALDFYRNSLEINEDFGDQIGQASALNNIGNIYSDQSKFNLALSYYKKSLKIREEVGDQSGVANTLNNIGIIYKNTGALKNALEYSERSIQISKKLGIPVEIKKAAFTLWEVYKRLGRYDDGLEMYELYNITRDSLESQENQKEVIRHEYKYQYEKQAAADSVKTAEAAKVKDAQLSAEQAENRQHQIEAQQQRQQKYFLYGGLSLAIIFGTFIFNRFRVTNKQKSIIEKQKDKVAEAYEELGEKNQEILDSINYAKRIQSAILPPQKLVKEYLPSSFILYKPKDIVAGDFYWVEPHIDGVLFAAADCTGHGVPGAMVSVVCNNGLNRSVREHGLSEPAKILDKTREIVIAEFEKSEEEVKDGMDIALCLLKENQLQYSGANNPLWIIRKDTEEIEEIKADKQPIGKFGVEQPFTNHTIELQKGDAIYLFSDGFADQFGGEKRKKFKSKNFKKLLLSIQTKSMDDQKIRLNEAIENWRGNMEQLDDICVIGVKV